MYYIDATVNGMWRHAVWYKFSKVTNWHLVLIMKEAGPCEVVVIISQRVQLAAWKYFHDNLAFHFVFNYIHCNLHTNMEHTKKYNWFSIYKVLTIDSKFSSGDWEWSSGFLEVIIFPLKMIQPRCALFEYLLKYSPTQHTYECYRLIISALLTNHNQNFILWRPSNEINPIPEDKFHWTVLITKKVWL